MDNRGIHSLMTGTRIPLIPFIPRDVYSGPGRSCRPVAHEQGSQKKSKSGPSPSDAFPKVLGTLMEAPVGAHSESLTLAAAGTFPVQCPLHVQLNQEAPVGAHSEILRTFMEAAIFPVEILEIISTLVEAAAAAAFGGINMTQRQILARFAM